jgi:hypothetical protein
MNTLPMNTLRMTLRQSAGRINRNRTYETMTDVSMNKGSSEKEVSTNKSNATHVNTRHSLHHALYCTSESHPESKRRIITKYTLPGEIVLDPFVATGSTVTEIVINGRIPFVADIDPLNLIIAQGRSVPADLVEIMKFFQVIQLQRPVAVEGYQEIFSPFYEMNTYRELVSLSKVISQSDDQIIPYIRLITLGLLHGHTPGFFSVKTYPQIALSPRQQSMFNARNRLLPEYRAVIPRIIRKAAYLARDCHPSIFSRDTAKDFFIREDGRNLKSIKSASVDAVVTTVPTPSSRSYAAENWIKCWFAGVEQNDLKKYTFESKQQWVEFFIDTLFEIARVLKKGKYCSLELADFEINHQKVSISDEMTKLLASKFSDLFHLEALTLPRIRTFKVHDMEIPIKNRKNDDDTTIFVLQRV